VKYKGVREDVVSAGGESGGETQDWGETQWKVAKKRHKHMHSGIRELIK